jgi:ribulose-5-phosphate 4-epimerase/fuculose-1-phosphate aldolase
VFAGHEPPTDPRVRELVGWCRCWAARGLTGKAMGNLSFRTGGGFIITPTGTDPATITTEQFVKVLGADAGRREVTVAGTCEPSSECMMHAGIYAARTEVGAVFHGHSDAVLAAAERLRIPVTEREVPYGTPEMVAEVLKILRRHEFLIMRNHGFVSLGQTMDEAGKRLEGVLEKL